MEPYITSPKTDYCLHFQNENKIYLRKKAKLFKQVKCSYPMLDTLLRGSCLRGKTQQSSLIVHYLSRRQNNWIVLVIIIQMNHTRLELEGDSQQMWSSFLESPLRILRSSALSEAESLTGSSLSTGQSWFGAITELIFSLKHA